jgi:hypothetical protein
MDGEIPVMINSSTAGSIPFVSERIEKTLQKYVKRDGIKGHLISNRTSTGIQSRNGLQQS